MHAVRTIRITDLRNPERDSGQQALYESALAMTVDLDPDQLVAAARKRTGLRSFGADHTVLDRLAAQVRAVEADTGLTGLGRYMIRRRLIGLLSARLRFEDFVRRFPEALEIPLDPPVVVMGLPRSGTTHLVNLLAADRRLRSLPWWEAAEPIPVWGDGPGPDGIDPRYLRSRADHKATQAVAPLTSYMHDRPPEFIEEECELMDLDFCAYPLEWHARVPSWRDHYFTLDQDAHYAFLYKELQVLSFLRGPQRWVLKSPHHLDNIGALVRTFPNATVALTMRDPVAVLQSAATMLAYGDRLRRVAIDADELGAYWLDRIERLLRSCVRDLAVIDTDRRVDVEFGAFTRDPLPVAERILTTAGLAPTRDSTSALSAYLARDTRARDTRIEYDLATDFGIDPADAYDRYRFYFEAFPTVRREVA